MSCGDQCTCAQADGSVKCQSCAGEAQKEDGHCGKCACGKEMDECCQNEKSEK